MRHPTDLHDLSEDKVLNNEAQQLSLPRSERGQLKFLFDTVLRYPRHLVTHNEKIMQRAYTLVPADIWGEKCMDLTQALQLSRGNELARRTIITGRAAGMSPMVDELLDAAFVNKYEELMARVQNDFEDFWPYKLARSNQKLMIFEKLGAMDLVEFVMKQL